MHKSLNDFHRCWPVTYGALVFIRVWGAADSMLFSQSTPTCQKRRHLIMLYYYINLLYFTAILYYNIILVLNTVYLYIYIHIFIYLFITIIIVL